MSERALVPIQVEGIWLAVEAGHVDEVLGRCDWVAIPGAPQCLPGVTPWKGRASAVLDLAPLLSLGPALRSRAPRDRTVVLSSRRGTVAVPVDVVREVDHVGHYTLQPVQHTLQRFTVGDVELRGMTIPILNVDAVVEAALEGRTET